MRLVQVEWLDHAEAEGGTWQSRKRAAKHAPIRFWTVGWIVSEDDTCFNVTSSVSEDDKTVARPFTIVKAAVVQVIDLV